MSRTHIPAGWSRAGLAALAAAGLAGCADLRRATGFDAGDINVESPVAPAALAATRARLVTPRFSEIPPTPLNAPSPALIKSRVGGQVADRQALEAWIAAHPQMTGDIEGFADAGRSAAAQGGAAPATDHTPAADAWAARARAEAAPPPPPQ